jgi:hypothetical protein
MSGNLHKWNCLIEAKNKSKSKHMSGWKLIIVPSLSKHFSFWCSEQKKWTAKLIKTTRPWFRISAPFCPTCHPSALVGNSG